MMNSSNGAGYSGPLHQHARPNPADDAALQQLKEQAARERAAAAGGDDRAPLPTDAPRLSPSLELVRQQLRARVANDFTYHAPTQAAGMKYTEIRMAGRQMAELLVELCPNGRELSTALSKLEECVMWANAGIARSG